MVIGGFIGGTETWRRLHEHWQPLLTKHGIAYFHSVECESGNKEFDKENNSKWKDPAARSDCRMEFVEAILAAKLDGFVAGVVSKDYQSLDRQAKTRIGKPFSLVAQTLVVMVKDWANEKQIYDLFPYFFEAGSEGYGEFSQVFNRVMEHEIRRNAYRMKSCGLVGKECIPAQAADLIAYEHSHVMNSILNRDESGFSRPAVKALGKTIAKAQYHDARSLAEMLSQPKSEYRRLRVKRV